MLLWISNAGYCPRATDNTGICTACASDLLGGLGGGGNGRADAGCGQFEPWLQQTVTALKQPLPSDVVEHWRTRRGEFIFDDNSMANVVVTGGML